MTIPKVIREHAKTVVAFVATFIGNAIVSMIKGETAIPQTRDEWLQYLGTSILAALGTFAARNKITQKQLDKDKDVIGGYVVSDAVPTEVQLPTTYQTNTGETRTMGQPYVPAANGSQWVA